MRKNNFIYLWPIIACITWLNISLFLFAYGPFSYPDINYLPLYFYILTAHIVLFLGYVFGINARGKNYKGYLKFNQLLKFCSYSSLVWVGITISIWPSLQEIIISYLAGKSSGIRAELFATLGGRWQDYAIIFLNPFVIILITAGIYYWSCCGKFTRFSIIITVMIKIITAIMTGGRIGVIEVLILSGVSYMSAHINSGTKIDYGKQLIFFTAILIAIAAYTSFITISRSGIDAGAFVESYSSPNPGALNKDSVIISLTPSALEPLTIQAIEYISHGYYPLTLALVKPFHGITFGLGHSLFLIRLADQVFNTNYFDSTSYYTRLLNEDHYSEQAFVTAYIWIANDFTFLGALFILFIIGNIFAKSWLDTRVGKNPFAVTVFSLIMFTLLSLPMFSTILDPGAFVTFYFIIFAWIFTRSTKS